MKGVHWLLQGQTPAGLLGNPGDSKHNYSHAMATMALAEAYAMSGDMRLRPPLEKAVEFVVAGQRPSGGWNYTNDPKSTRADTSVTGWQVMALVSARRAGVAVPEDTLKSASNWFESVTDSRTAMTGYEVNPSAERGKAVTRKYHSTTAISLLCRQSMPLDQDQRLLRRQANVLLDTPPEWSRGWQIDTCRKRVDLYYWYHGTEALFLIGGLQWERWNASLKRALLTTQETRGYWPGHTLWGLDGGRVFTTSLAVLCLTTYYRHP